MHCSADQYFEHFAGPYCAKFDAEIEGFTPQGQATLGRIKTCLQLRVEFEPALTCENALEKAYGHHRDCYLASGFCKMPAKDKFKIFEVIHHELSEQGFREAIVQTIAGCLRQADSLDQRDLQALSALMPTIH